MAQTRKKINLIVLIMSLTSFLGCGRMEKHTELVIPKPHGSKTEQIQYHMKEIERFSIQMKNEERSLKEALNKQDMDKAREAQNRRMQYQKKINTHISQLNQIEVTNEAQ